MQNFGKVQEHTMEHMMVSILDSLQNNILKHIQEQEHLLVNTQTTLRDYMD